MDWNLRPRRAPALEINEATDGFLVYHGERDRLHLLNATAVLVLEICDGTVRVGDLPGLFAEAFTLHVPPADDIEKCVADLLREGLLVVDEPPDETTAVGSTDRP
jgi:hypothetical protein